MQTMNIFRSPRRIAVLLCSMILGNTLLLSAEPPLDRPNPPDRPFRPDAPRRERLPGGLPRPGLQDPSLSEEQRAAIRQAMEATRKDAAPLEETMRAARRELQEAIHAEKIDEQVIREKAAAVGKIEGDLAIIRAKAFAKLRSSLTPEQLERMKNRPLGFVGPRPPGPEGRPGEPRRRGDQFDGPPGRPLPPGEDRGPDGTLPPPPKPRPPE